MTDPILVRRKSVAATLRASFLTGLVVVLPIALTIYLIWSALSIRSGARNPDERDQNAGKSS